jgi:6-pyruvoyltetrahydropterin/6-carboxytetrahydropterin synthase
VNSLVRIAKEFRWEMAHRLPYHKGGCENLHGHSYRMIVEVAGHTMENGMVMDFADLKSIVQPLVKDVDHSFMCSTEDRLMIDLLQGTDFKIVYVNFYTTAENIALHFREQLRTRLSAFANLEELRIRVYETPSSFADVRCELNHP